MLAARAVTSVGVGAVGHCAPGGAGHTLGRCHSLHPLARSCCRYGGRCLSFFSLDDDPREDFGNDLAFMLLDGIVQMLGQAPAWTYLPVGTQVVHPRRGVAVIEEMHADGLTLRFSTPQEEGNRISRRCRSPLGLSNLTCRAGTLGAMTLRSSLFRSRHTIAPRNRMQIPWRFGAKADVRRECRGKGLPTRERAKHGGERLQATAP